jgi:hypothetical protein
MNSVAAEVVTQADETRRFASEMYSSGLGINTEILKAAVREVSALTTRDSADLDPLVAWNRTQLAIKDVNRR